MADQCSKNHGDTEGVKPKNNTAVFVFLKVIKVDVHACQKHDIEQSDRAEEDHGWVLRKDRGAVRADEDACADQSDDRGET